MTAISKCTGCVRPCGLRGVHGTELALTSFSKEGCPIFSVDEEEKEPVMTGSATIPAPTLWDLATVVFEEVEKICWDERSAVSLAREILIHIIQGHVKNMEVEFSFSHVVTRDGKDRPGQGPGRRTLGG
jgi:hypothetical protein